MTTLTPERRALLQGRLDRAEEAYDRLMTGSSARVFVDQNGERIEYSVATKGNLSSYIASLQRQLGIGASGPLNVWMGR